jgi:hypothetical protein
MSAQLAFYLVVHAAISNTGDAKNNNRFAIETSR